MPRRGAVIGNDVIHSLGGHLVEFCYAPSMAVGQVHGLGVGRHVAVVVYLAWEVSESTSDRELEVREKWRRG